jgi:hypothetical protein
VPLRFVSLCLLGFAILASQFAVTSSATNARIISMNGSRISSVYYGLAPNFGFARSTQFIVDKMAADRRLLTIHPSESRQVNGTECLLRRVTFHGAPSPQNRRCFGQYMVPENFDCGGCDLDNLYEVFYNTGSDPHSGYYLPFLINDCNGCEPAERFCYNP